MAKFEESVLHDHQVRQVLNKCQVHEVNGNISPNNASAGNLLNPVITAGKIPIPKLKKNQLSRTT